MYKKLKHAGWDHFYAMLPLSLAMHNGEEGSNARENKLILEYRHH